MLQETIILVFNVKYLRENAHILNSLFDLSLKIAKLILLCSLVLKVTKEISFCPFRVFVKSF